MGTVGGSVGTLQGGQPRNIISLSDEDPDAHVMLSSKDARLL